MDEAFIPWRFRAELWSASFGMAVFAAYVALDVARGVASSHRPSSLRALAGSALALAVGTWSLHFIVMADGPLPFAMGYNGWIVFASLAVAYGGSLLACLLGSRSAIGLRSGLGAALSVGCATCATSVVALLALRLQPHVEWNWAVVVPGWLATCALAGGGLWLMSYRRAIAPVGVRWRAIVAVVLGSSMAAGNATVLLGAEVPLLALSSTGDLVGLATVTALAVVGVPILLVALLLTSLLEARFRAMLRRAREELQVAAYTDRLTGLPNRAMFDERLQRAVLKADRHEHRLALLFCNLDGLKAVNESFGQSSGDMVLREMAERLKQLTGERNVVSRAGGDEFLILVEGSPGKDDAARLAARVLAALHQPCRFDNHEVPLTCSIGIAMYPEDGALSKLVPHAAAAMNSVKRTGGAAHCFFEPRMVAGAREQVELLHDLRRAIEHRELELYYQPKIHAPSGQITGAEALMRWHHPQRGMVSPAVFIPLAERFGLINALGNWLIEDACRQIRVWRDQGLRMRVAINLSVHQLRQPDLAQRIDAALRNHRIDPSLLTCEITESAAMDDTRANLQILEELSAIGVHLSIDDFGTGYSSLSYLRKLPSEELKIDRSFVLDLESSADARAIVDAVVKLAQALGLKVVAEGVETEEQQAILRSLGCNELQGFLFAKPMSASALALWAMNDEGPAPIDFRASLFSDTLPSMLA